MPTPKKGYYTSSGKRVSGVTTILGNLGWKTGGLVRWANQQGLLGIDTNQVKEEAADIGTIAHQMIDDHLHSREFDPTIFDPELLPTATVAYGEFLRWEEFSQIEVIESEMQLVDDDLGFGGTPDAVAKVNGKVYLFDWKSSRGVYADYKVQVAAYFHLMKKLRPQYDLEPGAHLVRVGKTGDFAHYGWGEKTIADGWQVFEHLLAIHKLKKELEG
jgi:hypothetical protein